MTDDRELADLLGEAPKTPDPSFRIDVVARAAARARRRAAFDRAWKQVLAFTLIGLAVPVARGFGITEQILQPMLLVGAVLATAYLLAALTIQGPRPLLARSRTILRI